MSVRTEMRGDAMIVWLDNPPVNAIGQSLRAKLLETFKNLTGDSSIERVVLTGAGSIFAAGADAREFDHEPMPPHLPEVIAEIEACGKPVIAALNGAALGGGYELALACGYRIAAPSAKIGLPEVTLGIVPGAGGTQRLPRLVGIAKAVSIISQGRVIGSNEAHDLGLVDIVCADSLETALTLDLSLLSPVPLSRAPRPDPDPHAVATAREQVAKRLRNQTAPNRAIDLVSLAAHTDFDEAMRTERETFLELKQSDQARALRHVFFAERAAKKPDELKNIDPIEIKSALVVGGGTMGSSIAYALENIGIHVAILEKDKTSLAHARENVARLFDGAVKRGLITQDEAGQRQDRIELLEDIAQVPEVDIAIEAAIEDMAIKKAIFSRLAAKLPSHTLLATNTSYLDIDEIASATDNFNPDDDLDGSGISVAERVLGLHFFFPAHIMRLLEIVRGVKTGPTALATSFELAQRLRKVAILSGVCDGFIGNRILSRYREIADMLLIDGALPWQIDQAMVSFGYPMGPYAAQDLSGLDIAYANRKRLAATRDPERRYVAIADRMVEQGRLGKKAGVGWYRYPENGAAVVDPLVKNLICEESNLAGITRREFDHEEIRDRLLAAMINEAFEILVEGISARSSDIDLVLIHGYGFPRWRGGLLHYAETIGLQEILNQIRRYGTEDPVLWRPSSLLVEIVSSGLSLQDFELNRSAALA